MSKLSKILKALTSPTFVGYIAAKEYIKRYEGFSYNFERNGESTLLKSLASEPIQTIFDVGANVGDWTNTALRYFPNATIHAFELVASTFDIMRNNHCNSERVKPLNLGLSSRCGVVGYKDYGSHSTVNTIIDKVDYHDKKIPYVIKEAEVVTGDVYCKNNNIKKIDLLKIDVEGAEYLVLQGFEEMLKAKAIKIIQFEYGYANGDATYLMKDFFTYLNSFGYCLGPLKPNGVIFSEFKYPLNNFTSGPNFVAVLESEITLLKKVSGPKIQGFPR